MPHFLSYNCVPKLFLVWTLLVVTPAHANFISRDRIAPYVDSQASMVLLSSGYSVAGIPPQLQAEYNECKAQARQELELSLKQNWRIFTDEDEIRRVVTSKLNRFIATLSSLVFAHEVDTKVAQKITNFLALHGLYESSIPKDQLQNFYTKKYAVIDQLQQRMRNDGRGYLRSCEIESAIEREFAGFVYSVCHPEPSAPPLVDWICNLANNWNKPVTPSAPSAPPIAPVSPALPVNASYVAASQIESAVLAVAREVLRSEGIAPENVAARAVSDYSEHIQKSIARTKKFAAAAWDGKVARSQIETIVREELKPVIDKIKLRSEQCAICQEGYTRGQTIGFLQCGHLFHDDCIHTSLAYKQQCPLCRASATIVTQKEVVG